MKDKITLNKLKEVLNYNYKTGIFIWIVNPAKNVKAGDEAGTISDGYIQIRIFGIIYRAHRLAWFYYYGYWPENGLDHKDRIRHHNWIKNLREVSQTCNIRNKSIHSNNTSGVTGVCFNERDNRWLSTIKAIEKRVYIGQFKEFPDAVKARWKAEKKYKFPNCCTTSTAYEYLKSNNLI